MDLITDSLLLAATFGAGLYCHVLARRLRRFTTLETGMGGAIAVLSAQVDDMTRAVQRAQTVAAGAEQRLEVLVTRAEALCRRLDLAMAAMHDLSDPVTDPPPGAASQHAARSRILRRRRDLMAAE